MESVVSHSTTMTPQYIFSRTSAMAKSLPPSVRPEPQAALHLYAFEMQANDGDNHTSPPDGTDPVEKGKWDMWKQLEGLSEEIASRQYVVTLQSVLRASDSPDAKRMLDQLKALSGK